MKLTIKVKKLEKFGILPQVIKKGEWIDLRARGTTVFSAPQAGTLKKHKVNGVEESHRDVSFDMKLIPLGVAMKLPKGFEAVVVSRSSTYKKCGILQANSLGVIDGKLNYNI